MRRRGEGQPIERRIHARAGGSSRRGGAEPVAEVRWEINCTTSDTGRRSDDRGRLRAALLLTGPSCFFFILQVTSVFSSTYKSCRFALPRCQKLRPGRGAVLGGARVGAVSEGKGRCRGRGSRGGERRRAGSARSRRPRCHGDGGVGSAARAPPGPPFWCLSGGFVSGRPTRVPLALRVPNPIGVV